MSDNSEISSAPISSVDAASGAAAMPLNEDLTQRVEPADSSKPFKVRILWGQTPEPDDEPKEYEFATHVELEGWMDYESVMQNPDGTWEKFERESDNEEEEDDDGRKFGVCILTGAPGENPDDCTTHAHEKDGE